MISSNRIVLINLDLCCNIVANSKVSDLTDEFRVLVLTLVECLFVLGRLYVWFWIWSIFLLGCGEKENTDTELYCNGNTLDN